MFYQKPAVEKQVTLPAAAVVPTAAANLQESFDSEPVREPQVTAARIEEPENTATTEPTNIAAPAPALASPNQQDTLFWCIYIAIHGYGEYSQISRNYGVKELEIKKQIAEHVTKNPYKMKHTNHKITKIMVQEILSELLTSQKDTSLLCLHSLCVYYNIHLLLVDSSQKLALEFLSDKSVECPTYVLYKDTYGKYKINTESLTPEEASEFKSKMICLEHYDKPLRPISSYKCAELEEIAKKVGILNETKKYKKNDLYEEIVAACTWR